jgi:hypothetical protein
MTDTSKSFFIINLCCFLSRKGKNQKRETKGVSHSGLGIYIKKYLTEKEELLKLKYFIMYKYNLQKIL